MEKFKFLLFLVFFLFLSVLVFILYQNQNNLKPLSLQTIEINDKKILVEVADTPQKREKGLMGRKSLPENQGMLFIFENPDYYPFWMKNTFIPLDFIWIKDNQIVDITQDIKPEDYQPPKFLVPKNKADKVLEVNAGFTQKFNIKVGDKVSF